MLRPINAIIQDNVGNIIHRGFVVTGEVAVDNGDGSYDVYIAGEAKAYPKIFTLARNPDLSVGDTVRILYKNGCKELPIILPPVKPTAIRYHAFAFLCGKDIGAGWHDYLSLYDLDGNVIKEIIIDDYAWGTYNQTCLDPQGNVYNATGGEKIRKYDRELNLLLTHDIEEAANWITAINMGSDGYLYTLEVIASGYDTKKRSILDLTIQESIHISTDPSSYFDGLCLDTSGNFYVWNRHDDYVEKYNSSGAKIASHYIDCTPVPCFGVIGMTLYFGGATYPYEGYYLPTNLSSHTIWEPEHAVNYRLTVVDGTHIICAGWAENNDSILAKYDSNRNLIWRKVIGGGGGNPWDIGAYNF